MGEDSNWIAGLLDSGSHVTLVGAKGLDLITECDVVTLPSPVYVKSASDCLHTCCQVSKAPYTYKDKTCMVPTLIVPELPRDLILGIDFWKTFGIAPELFETAAMDLIDKDTITADAEIPKLKYIFHNLTPQQLDELELVKFEFLASTDDFIGCTNLIEHVIETPDIAPTEGIRQKPYVFSPHDQPAINRETERMIRLKVISRAVRSSWASP